MNGEINIDRDFAAPGSVSLCALADVATTNTVIPFSLGNMKNTAARMESHGIPGEIQVSEATYQLLQSNYHFCMIDIKGKGQLKAFLLNGRVWHCALVGCVTNKTVISFPFRYLKQCGWLVIMATKEENCTLCIAGMGLKNQRTYKAKSRKAKA